MEVGYWEILAVNSANVAPNALLAVLIEPVGTIVRKAAKAGFSKAVLQHEQRQGLLLMLASAKHTEALTAPLLKGLFTLP